MHVTDLPFDPATVDISHLAKQLHLAFMRRAWKDVVSRAETEEWTYTQFLASLLLEETAQRRNTRIQRSVRRARFPVLRTLEDFDFSLQTTVKQALLGSFLGPDFVSEGRNVILYGKTGRGKTHLATAIAYRAIQNGFTARFVTAAELIDRLSAASRRGELHDAIEPYLQPHVLVIDEVGYIATPDDAANVLFHVVNNRHLGRRPMVFTTNKSPLDEWGEVLHDSDLADVIVDRVLERGRILPLDGPSYRTRHLIKPPSKSLAEPARVSGMDRPEFPEPAVCPGDVRHPRRSPRR